MTHYDIIIIGGGLVGLSIGTALASHDISVAIIDKQPLEHIKSQQADGRASAIAAGSKAILARFGLWEDIEPSAGPINEIRITDGNCPLFLHFDHQQVGDQPLGYMVENQQLLTALIAKAETLPSLQIYSGVTIAHTERGAHHATVTLQDGKALQAPLLIAADGKFSRAREEAGLSTINWSYKQTAIVCTIGHERHHQGIAQERFLPAGPFAILPLKDGYHSSLVWTEKSSLAPLYMAMNDADFLHHLGQRFGEYLGKLTVTSKRFSYPLSVSYAPVMHAARLVLVGDAAHAIHPIAGQGFNLGLRDVEALADTLLEYHQLGIDLGSDVVLEHYQKRRRTDNMAMLAITDSLTHFFSNDIAPIRHARRIGLAVVNKLPKLQAFFMKYAMGE